MPQTAIFDLDSTLTRRGCYTPFVLHVARRRPRRFLSLPRILFAAAGLALKLTRRDDVKALIWRKVLAGLERDEVLTLGREFGEAWAAKELRRQTRDVLARHKAAGDRLVMATAAMDIVAEPFAQALGFDLVIATRTGWTADDRVADAFAGLNCYGEEKLRRVVEALPDLDPATAVSYSDHVTDLPLLTWTGKGVAVNPHPPLADAARRHGLRIEDWD